MIYWFVLGGLFLLGGTYVMLNGAKLVREDNEIQDQLSTAQKRIEQHE